MNFDEAFAISSGEYELTLTSNQPKGLVSYARGLVIMKTVPGSRGGLHGDRRVLKSEQGQELQQTFSDRYGMETRAGVAQPFDAAQPDLLGIAVYAAQPVMRRDRTPVSPYVLELTLASWGGGTLTAELNRVGDVLVGQDPGGPGERGAYLLSLRPRQVPR